MTEASSSTNDLPFVFSVLVGSKEPVKIAAATQMFADAKARWVVNYPLLARARFDIYSLESLGNNVVLPDDVAQPIGMQQTMGCAKQRMELLNISFHHSKGTRRGETLEPDMRKADYFIAYENGVFPDESGGNPTKPNMERRSEQQKYFANAVYDQAVIIVVSNGIPYGLSDQFVAFSDKVYFPYTYYEECIRDEDKKTTCGDVICRAHADTQKMLEITTKSWQHVYHPQGHTRQHILATADSLVHDIVPDIMHAIAERVMTFYKWEHAAPTNGPHSRASA